MKRNIVILISVLSVSIVFIVLLSLFLKNTNNLDNKGNYFVESNDQSVSQVCSIPEMESVAKVTEYYEKNGGVYLKNGGNDSIVFSSSKEKSLVYSRLSPDKNFIYILATNSVSGGYSSFIYDVDKTTLNDVSSGDCGLNGARWIDDGNILLFGQGGHCEGGVYMSLDANKPWLVGKIGNGSVDIPGSNFPISNSDKDSKIIKALGYEGRLDGFSITSVDNNFIKGQYHFKAGGGAIFIALVDNENISIIFEGNDLPLPCEVMNKYNLPESIRGQDCIE